MIRPAIAPVCLLFFCLLLVDRSQTVLTSLGSRPPPAPRLVASRFFRLCACALSHAHAHTRKIRLARETQTTRYPPPPPPPRSFFPPTYVLNYDQYGYGSTPALRARSHKRKRTCACTICPDVLDPVTVLT